MVNKKGLCPFDHAHKAGWARACAVCWGCLREICVLLLFGRKSTIFKPHGTRTTLDNVPTGDNEL